jgi:hypothetical protein
MVQFPNVSITLPANIIGTGTVITGIGDTYYQTSSSAATQVMAWYLGGTAVTSNGTFITTANSLNMDQTTTFGLFGHVAPSGTSVVDVTCGAEAGSINAICRNFSPGTATSATNGALTLAPYFQWSAATASNAIWMRGFTLLLQVPPSD